MKVVSPCMSWVMHVHPRMEIEDVVCPSMVVTNMVPAAVAGTVTDKVAGKVTSGVTGAGIASRAVNPPVVTMHPHVVNSWVVPLSVCSWMEITTMDMDVRCPLVAVNPWGKLKVSPLVVRNPWVVDMLRWTQMRPVETDMVKPWMMDMHFWKETNLFGIVSHLVVVDSWEMEVRHPVDMHLNMHLNMEMKTHVDMVNPFVVVHPWVIVEVEPWATQMHLKMEMNTPVDMVNAFVVMHP
jgi:hypothetical protein